MHATPDLNSEQLSFKLVTAMDAYWDAAYAEGRDGRAHDTPDGAAQRAMQALHAAILADRSTAVAAECEQWSRHLSAARNMAEANNERGDDCGTLARTLLDALRNLVA